MPSDQTTDDRSPQRGVGAGWRAYTTFVTRARWALVLLWLLIVAGATYYLPAVQTTSGGFGSLIPSSSPAVQAQRRSAQEFGIPLVVDTIVVAHNGSGLPSETLKAITTQAAQVDQDLPQLRASGSTAGLPTDRPVAAVPVPDTAAVGGTPGRTTTVLTYLYFSPSLSAERQTALAQQYADRIPTANGTTVAVTGTVPASVEQANESTSNLRVVEIATVVFVFLIVAVTFRSLIAPLITLVAAVLSYLVSMRVLGFVGEYTSLSLPPPLEPLIIALVLGILTDYSVFYFTENRLQLRQGAEWRVALRSALTNNSPIIAVAGLTVAIGTAALYSARVRVYAVFGPGLAISVVVAVAVALSFVPALIAILGRRVYWPSHPQSASRHGGGGTGALAPSWLIRGITSRLGAALATLLTVLALGAAAYPLGSTALEFSFIRGLPASAGAQVGATAAANGFPPGVIAPTVVLVEGQNVIGQRQGLTRLQTELEHVPGVASVLGPSNSPLPDANGVFLARDGNAARYLVLLSSDPLGGPAIAHVDALTRAGPQLLSLAGLDRASLSVAGETAIASAAAAETATNLRLVLLVAFAAEFVILAIYLRALLAPVLLLAASGLVVAASLGLTTLVFQDGFHSQGLTFYAPFATSVLLVALGSDYNVFGIGRIWEYAATNRLREAMRRALPESTRAIITAGIVLAGSFAMVAFIPLLAFREMAFTMFIGLLLDTFLVRSILTPALLTLVGPAAGWPGHRLAERRRR